MNQYKSKVCFWQGVESQLNYEPVESCMGDDKIEICPACGGMDVFFLNIVAEH